ncbi:DUF5131 family protein [Mesorhizobium sp. WSM2239]|uniref:DUF5131 family protein n=2 Tax=unclassified Mesorhizobium TaxID=325217 RepID=A0AAU8D1D6_9HYPH
MTAQEDYQRPEAMTARLLALPRRLPWHPWTGCSPISPSCLNCYAVPETGDLVVQTRRGPVWNGRLRFNEGEIDLPRRTPPHAYFDVCPHGDAFHESAPDAWLDRVFAVMEAERYQRFVVMTKRADRMLSYLSARYYGGRRAPGHIAFGVGVERQLEANQRIPALLAAPAQTKYLTVYALLGPLDLDAIPGVDRAALRQFCQVIVGEGWLTPSADSDWYAPVVETIKAIGVPIMQSDLLADAERRGY